MTDKDNNNPNEDKGLTPTDKAANEKKKKILKIVGILALVFIALPILIFGTCILLINGIGF